MILGFDLYPSNALPLLCDYESHAVDPIFIFIFRCRDAQICGVTSGRDVVLTGSRKMSSTSTFNVNGGTVPPKELKLFNR
ncbi:MAG: hypothetical protein WCB11_04010 [Terriglobales bacterium]